jgi:signal transduction histidine kinase
VEAVGGSVSTRHLQRVLRLLNAGRVEAVSAYVDRRDTEIARAHSQHVAFVAHELRSPLMNAFMAATALRKKARSEDQWTLSLLTRNLTALRELADQVLTADRLAGHVQLTRESLDLRTLLDQAVIETRLAAQQREIELVVTAPDALPFSGDRRLLRSAIGNLLGNARQVHPGGRHDHAPGRVIPIALWLKSKTAAAACLRVMRQSCSSHSCNGVKTARASGWVWRS